MIRKRDQNDIWKNLYDFPLLETAKEVGKGELLKLMPDKRIIIKQISHDCTHILTHQVIHAKFWEMDSNSGENMDGFYISDNQIVKYAFPRLIEKYLQREFLKKS